MSVIIVVGGGAAGMMAAITAARQGAGVTLLEPNERLGKKLNITGKGRCNVTNDCDQETLMANIPGNSRFLYSALTRFTPQDTMAFFPARWSGSCGGCTSASSGSGRRRSPWRTAQSPAWILTGSTARRTP